jgi:hypothetical protein
MQSSPRSRATDIGDLFSLRNKHSVCRSLRELENVVANLTQHSPSLVLGFTLTVRFTDSLNGFFTHHDKFKP